ncbi:glycine betaine ABC transporter substrate-binding protein [Glutamicibacter creatinolyticus]|uniref:glycine betaine ABC transporter substrate-binding protein n=1 Tax=Glutamicibacter creatinolyticus TaxID=162496 RepID=UPI0031D24E7E
MQKTTLKLSAIAAASALALTGCSAAGADDADKKIKLAVFNGWDEALATSLLWEAVLEEKGYDVELEYADLAPALTGLSQGDYDFTTDVWMPITHASFIEQYEDDLEKVGVWNDEGNAALTLAVNEDAPIDSIDELAEKADLFGNKIVSIEPGSGIVNSMENEVIPAYGLQDMEFATSSTAAMLAEVKAATTAKENVLVTLWQPHWAYSQFPLKNLKDPKGVLNTDEELSIYSRTGFADDFPEVNQWLQDFEMSLDQLYDLENLLFVENDTDDYAPLIKQWMEDNKDYVEGLTS